MSVEKYIEYEQRDDGGIYRVVRTRLGQNLIVTSDTHVTDDLDEFRASHPNQALKGTTTGRAPSVQEALAAMSDEEIEALGLIRVDSDAPDDDEVDDEDDDGAPFVL